VATRSKPVTNSRLILREEFDDWAILFDPDSGRGFGLNPVSVFIWRRLDGNHTEDDIVAELMENCEEVPEHAGDDVREFIDELVRLGFVGYEIKQL
jgi:SynChlorMet cassette protein ScmD